MTLSVEVSPGELVDKITILEIKLDRIADPEKRRNVEHEYRLLEDVARTELTVSSDLARLRAELKRVNEIIWDVEDDIRDHERRQDFGPSFIALARSVYHNNDRRAALKRDINLRLDSMLVEEKSYKPY